MARESMSNIDIAAWVHTTGKDSVLGARISNIYRLNEVFLVKLHTKQAGKNLLLVEPGRRIHFTRRVETPKTYRIDSLLGTFRKHLRGRVITSVRQLNQDRIVLLEASNYKLIIEIMKKGIIALLDKEDNIVVSNQYKVMKDRQIKPKQKYVPPPPPPTSLTSITPEVLAKNLPRGKDLIRGLVRGLGLPGEFAEEVIHRSGLPKDLNPMDLTREETEELADIIKGLYNEALKGKGYLVLHDGKPYLAVSFKPTYYFETEESEVERYDVFDEALDRLFAEKPSRANQLNDIILEETGKLLSSIEKQKALVEEYLRKSEDLRQKATFMAQHVEEFQKIIDYVKKVKEQGDWSSVGKLEWVKTYDPSKGLVTIITRIGEISLSIREPIDTQINQLFRKAGELEGKAKRARQKLGNLEKMLEEAKKRAVKKYLSNLFKRRPRDWYEKYHWSLTRNGFLVIAGRNADQNESIVKKYLNETDIFLHAEIHGAPATILKTNGNHPTQEDLYDAALIAASYSRAWSVGAGSIDVFWVYGSQVSKSPPSGEYITKGAFMVYGKKNYISGLEVKLYLGFQPYSQDYMRILVGNEEAVRKRSVVYFELRPGDITSKKAVENLKKLVCKSFQEKLCMIIDAFPDEEIIDRLPGKTGRIKVYRGDVEYQLPY